nr:hypothetical protein [Tanacetum cinerariifolium]
MWFDQEKKIQKIDRLARSLLIQGLLNDIYSLIDSNKIAKDLWDALAKHMLGSEYGEQDRKAAKKTIVVTSDPLALIAEKTKVSKRKEKVVVSSDSEGSDAHDFNCKKAKVKDYEYYKTKMLLAKKDKDEQVLLAEDHALMESSSDSDQEINANMVFMAQIKKVLSDLEASSLSADNKISEVSYYLSESKSEYEYETSEYYDNTTTYGFILNDNDDQEIFHDCENFPKNLIESQIDHNESDVDHNDSEGIDNTFNCNNARNALCNDRMNAYVDVNDLFVFDDASIRKSHVSKRPFRKKLSASLNVPSRSKLNKSLPRIVHKWFSKLQPSTEPVAKWIPIIFHIYLWIIDSGCSKHMTGNRDLLMNFVKKFLGTVRFGNNDFAVIVGYGDVRVRTDNGTEFKNKALAKFFDEVGITQQFSAARTPQQNGVVERRNRTLVEAARTMLTFANLPLFLWAEAIATTCFIQNRLIIHKRFDKTPYELMNKRKQDIKFFHVFECRCFLLNDYDDVGKIMKSSTMNVETSNVEIPSNEEEVFHEIEVPSWNTQLVSNNMVPNVDEASTSHNVFNKRLEDAYFDANEASEVIISFIKKTQVNFQLQVQRVRTDNGTEFKNKTLAKFYDEVGITQQFSAARTPQKNGVVERRNQTLVEAARTMLTFDLGKLKAKGDIGVFVGYSKEYVAFRIYNKLTHKIHESVNVNFDENLEMASKQFSLEPGLSNLNETGKSSNPSVSQVSKTSKKDLEDLFQKIYDEYFDSSKIMKSSTMNVKTFNVKVPSNEEEVFHESSESFQEESSSSSLNDDVQQSSEKFVVPSSNTQSISNNMIPNVDEASTSHNVFNERLEDAYFDASTSFHDPSNVHTFYQPYPHEKKWTKDHPLHKIIGNPKSSVCTRSQLANSCLLSSIEPANVAEALKDVDWVSPMQDELDQFARLKVWRLVPRPEGKSIIKTKWIFKNKKAKSIVAGIEAIRLFLAYAAYKDFTVFQMDVKTSFLDGILKDEVYVGQPLGFVSKQYPDHVYALDKAFYGLKQSPWAWYDVLS